MRRFSLATIFGLIAIAAIYFSIRQHNVLIALVFIVASASVWRVVTLSFRKKITLCSAILNGGLAGSIAMLFAVLPTLGYIGYELLLRTWSTNHSGRPVTSELTVIVVWLGGGSFVVGMAVGLATHATVTMSASIAGSDSAGQV